jgi:hypothetical protein
MASVPKSVPAAFEQFDSAISLSPVERARAMVRHQKINVVLTDTGLAVTTFLQGSFARKTMRRPLKDVDIVVLLPAALMAEYFTPAGARCIHERFKPALLALRLVITSSSTSLHGGQGVAAVLRRRRLHRRPGRGLC